MGDDVVAAHVANFDGGRVTWRFRAEIAVYSEQRGQADHKRLAGYANKCLNMRGFFRFDDLLNQLKVYILNLVMNEDGYPMR